MQDLVMSQILTSVTTWLMVTIVKHKVQCTAFITLTCMRCGSGCGVKDVVGSELPQYKHYIPGLLLANNTCDATCEARPSGIESPAAFTSQYEAKVLLTGSIILEVPMPNVDAHPKVGPIQSACSIEKFSEIRALLISIAIKGPEEVGSIAGDTIVMDSRATSLRSLSLGDIFRKEISSDIIRTWRG
mgnify:CR=1 FL=1